MGKEVSVVIATYNREPLLLELLGDLARQTVPPERMEAIVVDDGSRAPVRAGLEAMKLPYELLVIEQQNQGPAAARHQGILRAASEIVVIVDDDMRVGPDFLAQHLAAHARGSTLVLGHIADDHAAAARLPLFERMRSAHLRATWEAFRTGKTRVRGVNTCTGNVSLRRHEYLAVGGFDRSLPQSEDRELGLRLEKAGARLAFADRARSVHHSDITDLDVWMRRNFRYGAVDLRIAQKHPDEESADPWRYLFMINPVSAALVMLSLLAPAVGAGLPRAALRVSMTLDRAGAERAALAGATLCFGLEYFRGVRHEAGSLRTALRGLGAYLDKRRA